MKKKIYYYKLNLKSYTKVEYSNDEVKKCLKKAINGQNTVRLSPEENKELDSIMNMDILSDDENFLFFRIGKAVDDNNGLIRDVDTSEVSQLDDNKILEIYTYGFIDYKYGILGYLNSNQAPKPKCINGLCKYLDEEFFNIDLENIVSKETVNALCKPGSTLNKIEYSFLHPNMSILAELGLSKEQVAKITLDKSVKIKLVITNGNKGFLTNSVESIKNICSTMKFDKNLKDKKLRGKTEGSTTKDYSFEPTNFYSEIDINTTFVENEKIKKLSLKQVEGEFTVKSKRKYLEERSLILNYADIEF